MVFAPAAADGLADRITPAAHEITDVRVSGEERIGGDAADGGGYEWDDDEQRTMRSISGPREGFVKGEAITAHDGVDNEQRRGNAEHRYTGKVPDQMDDADGGEHEEMKNFACVSGTNLARSFEVSDEPRNRAQVESGDGCDGEECARVGKRA